MKKIDQKEKAYLAEQEKRKQTREELVAIVRANADRLMLSKEHILELDAIRDEVILPF